MGVDAGILDALRPAPLGPGERVALRDRYSDGECLAFAFAVHWMTGWPVRGVSEARGRNHLHFAAVGPDGTAWDASGPRALAECGKAYADRPRWQDVDASRLLRTQPGVDEDAVTEACLAAIGLFAGRIDPFLLRLPEVPEHLAPGRGPQR